MNSGIAVISDKTALIVLVVASVVILLLIYATYVAKGIHIVNIIGVLILVLFIGIILVLRLPESYRYRDFDLNTESNKFNLVYDAEYTNKEQTMIKVTYLDKTFESHVAEVRADEAIVGTTASMVNLGGTYQQYLDVLGLVTVEREQKRNLLILNKNLAIRLGMIEATGSDDEKPFDFGNMATPSEMVE